MHRELAVMVVVIGRYFVYFKVFVKENNHQKEISYQLKQ
jgi:hypothetical protein